MKVPVLCLALLIWGSVLCGGVWYLDGYANQAEPTGSPKVNWPASSLLGREEGSSTLVMALLPACACSRASLQELRSVLESASTPVTVDFLVAGAADNDLAEWSPAARIFPDVTGAEIAKHAARVSGEVWFYDQHGLLRFHGGITGARGHIGANVGAEALRRLLQGEIKGVVAQTPVFGCSLQSADLSKGTPR